MTTREVRSLVVRYSIVKHHNLVSSMSRCTRNHRYFTVCFKNHLINFMLPVTRPFQFPLTRGCRLPSLPGAPTCGVAVMQLHCCMCSIASNVRVINSNNCVQWGRMIV